MLFVSSLQLNTGQVISLYGGGLLNVSLAIKFSTKSYWQRMVARIYRVVYITDRVLLFLSKDIIHMCNGIALHFFVHKFDYGFLQTFTKRWFIRYSFLHGTTSFASNVCVYIVK